MAELMIVLVVVGLALAASWGNFQSLLRQRRLMDATSRLVTHLRLAREQAVAEGNEFIVTFRVANNDYEVWDDEGNDAIFGPEDQRTTFPMPNGTRVESASFFGSNRVVFRPDGSTDASGAVEVSNGENIHEIKVLASTGKVTVKSP